MQIIPCEKHAALWKGVNAFRDETWDHAPGYGLVASATINGQAEFLRCAECRWESEVLPADGLVYPAAQSKLPTSPAVAAVEQALHSVGNPSISIKPRGRVGDALPVLRFSPLGGEWVNPEDAEAYDKLVSESLKALPIIKWKSGAVIGPVGTGKPKRAKEKNVARDKAETPKKRDRTPKKAIISRKFGANIEVAVYLKGGTIEDVLALDEAERKALFDLLTSIKGETPKGA